MIYGAAMQMSSTNANSHSGWADWAHEGSYTDQWRIILYFFRQKLNQGLPKAHIKLPGILGFALRSMASKKQPGFPIVVSGPRPTWPESPASACLLHLKSQTSTSLCDFGSEMIWNCSPGSQHRKRTCCVFGAFHRSPSPIQHITIITNSSQVR